MIRRSIRRKGLETEDGRAEIDLWTKELLELLDRTDSLFFSKDEIVVKANVKNLDKVIGFIESKLDELECPVKTRIQICVAVEEIFTNIAKYAYLEGEGDAAIRVEGADEGSKVRITFTDSGRPYDPLTVKDPDVTLSAEDRAIGGLGLFMVKKTMDGVEYEYKGGKNVLILTKVL